MNDSLTWKRRLGRVYSLLPSSRGDKSDCAVVLTYHSVGATPNGLPVETFREQMSWLRDHATVVNLNTLVHSDLQASPKRITCAITFDDGYASVYRTAFPVLKSLDMPATVYLVADAIGDSVRKGSNEFDGLYPHEEMLVWREVREMKENGISFGSHLLRHKDLTLLSDAEKKAELEGSKQEIEQRLGTECSSFCYPWGKHDDRSVAAVKGAGYKDAVIAIQGRWRAKDEVDVYRIPRADVRRDYSLDDFKAVVKGDWDYLGYLQSLRRVLR